MISVISGIFFGLVAISVIIDIFMPLILPLLLFIIIGFIAFLFTPNNEQTKIKE